MQRRLFLGLVPVALLAAACSSDQPPDQFDVTTAPVETAAPDAFAYQVGDLDPLDFAQRLASVNAEQRSYKLTIETPEGEQVNTMQVLRELDQDGSLRLHAWGEIDQLVQELITIGDQQWLKVDGAWQPVAGLLLFGGEGDKVEIFTSMLTAIAYEGPDEHGHRFSGTINVAGYENQETHDHDDHDHDHDDHDHQDEQTTPVPADVTFWTDAALRVVRLTHALDDDARERLTTETRTAFGQAFNISAPM
ncbi:hypothetical protein [Aestuariimicrobium sp. Y1814]|uniref:hypothetical protein n=1 Tax=Aestuariimicrobium sp. Y1814 TaxID=3418742 RepID=UPI003DA71EFD